MSLVRVDTIKPITSSADLSLQGDNGGSAVDCLNITSAGDVDFSGNADAKIKLPSAGGLYESDGSTAILTESGGAVTLDNVALGGSVTGGPTQYVKAWVHFNGTGTVAIGAQYNVSSITDNGTGLYRVNFDDDMSDANYSVVGSIIGSTGGYAAFIGGDSGANNVGYCTIKQYGYDGTSSDVSSVNIIVVR
jgi:hypothetical protein|tara:strand:+ start:780 stop:1352 length:573 start_codon:yes stop_codon:yes gene_type:complete